MMEDDEPLETKQKLIIGTFAIGFVVIGVLALIYPDALSGYDVSGRRGLMKSLVKYAWGTVGGSIAIVIGLLGIYRVVSAKSKETEAFEELEAPDAIEEEAYVPPKVTKAVGSNASLNTSAETDVCDHRKYAPPGYFD